MTAVTVTPAQVALFKPLDPSTHLKDYIALEALTAGAAVYIDPTTGKVGLCDGNAAGKYQFRGIALNAAGAGQAVTVCENGEVTGFTLAGAYDSLVYVGDTAGVLDTAAGTKTIPAGRVQPATDRSGTKILSVFVNRVVDVA